MDDSVVYREREAVHVAVWGQAWRFGGGGLTLSIPSVFFVWLSESSVSMNLLPDTHTTLLAYLYDPLTRKTLFLPFFFFFWCLWILLQQNKSFFFGKLQQNESYSSAKNNLNEYIFKKFHGLYGIKIYFVPFTLSFVTVIVIIFLELFKWEK